MPVTSQIHIGLVAWTSLSGTIAVGQRCSNAGNAYEATTSSTKGATAPTHTSGTVSDGSVSWKWLSAINFTTVASWVASIPSTLADAYIGELWNDTEVLFTSVTPISISGKTTTNTNRIILRCAQGESIAHKGDSEPFTYNATRGVSFRSTSEYSAYIVNCSNDYTTIEGIQGKSSPKSEGYRNVGVGAETKNCIFILGTTGGNTAGVYAGGTISNCLIVLNNASNAVPVQFFSGASGTNLTIVRPNNFTATGSAAVSTYGTAPINNCVVSGFTSAMTGNYSGSNNAFTNIASAPSSGLTGSLTVSHADCFLSTTEDYRLKSGSPLIDSGANRTEYIANSIDFFGSTRPSGFWDIGAHEKVGAAASESATPSGFTLTATTSLVAGTTTAIRQATHAGTGLTASASLAAGTASAVRQAAPAGFASVATATLAAGAAVAGVTVRPDGAALTSTATFAPGLPSVATVGTIPGVSLSAVAGIIPGGALGQRIAAPQGATLGASAALTAGQGQSVRQAAPVAPALAATAAFAPGAVSGVGAGEVAGLDLTAGASLVAGVALGARVGTASGATLGAVSSFVPGLGEAINGGAIPGASLSAETAIVAGGIIAERNSLPLGATLGAAAAFQPGSTGAGQSANPIGASLEASATLIAGAVVVQDNAPQNGAVLAVASSFAAGTVSAVRLGSVQGANFAVAAMFIPGAVTLVTSGEKVSLSLNFRAAGKANISTRSKYNGSLNIR